MPICPESQYIIDCMTTLCEITVDVAEFVYHTRVDIDGLVDENANIRRSIIDLYRSWRPKADLNEQAYISLRGILDSEMQFDEISTYVTDKLINAYRVSNGKQSSGGFPQNNLYIEKESDMYKEENIIHLLERNKEQEWIAMLGTMFNDFCDVKSKLDIKGFLKWEQNRIRQISNNIASLTVNNISPKLQKNHQKKQLIALKQGKKVLKKGIKTFTNLFGQQDIKAFISGEDFIIEGDLYNYRVSKKYNLIQYSVDTYMTHIPYRLQLLTKENIVLADGCIIFENTPVIDQLIAMMLHIKNGNEEEILKKTNFFNTQDAYYAEKYITDLKGVKRNPNDNEFDISDIERLFNPDGEREDILRYRPLVRPVVESLLCDMVDIPQRAFKFMMKPGMTYDNLQFLEASEMEQLLLEVHN